MFNLPKRKYWLVGLIMAIITFVLVFIGVKVVLGNAVTIQNVVFYIVFSGLVGGLTATMVFFKLKASFILFLTGLLIGFFEMYRAFFNRMTGWGDLIGIISLLIWGIIGLGVGIVIQFIIYAYKKFNKN
jgi:hypothetical protein